MPNNNNNLRFSSGLASAPEKYLLSRAAYIGKYSRESHPEYYFNIFGEDIGYAVPGMTPGMVTVHEKPRAWGSLFLRELDLSVNPFGPSYMRLKDTVYEKAHNAPDATDVWSIVMLHLEGMWAEIDMTHMFENQFNTPAFDGITDEITLERYIENYNARVFRVRNYSRRYLFGLIDKAREILSTTGIRIMASDIIEVHNDRRPFAMKCWYCGHTEKDALTKPSDELVEKPCPKPGCKGALRNFTMLAPLSKGDLDKLYRKRGYGSDGKAYPSQES